MGRKKKYENALIVKDILARETQALGDMQASIMFRFLDLKKKDDRAYLKKQAEQMIQIFTDAVKELEEKKDESNDKSADESVEKKKTLEEKDKI